jgi:phosphate transport system protein
MVHILKSYDNDLAKLKSMLIDMMTTNLTQLNLLHSLVSKFSKEIQDEVCDIDSKINELDAKIIDESIKIFSLRNPVAYDLRFVFSASHVSRNLERMGDNAKSISRYISSDFANDTLKNKYLEMLHLLIEMLHLTIESFTYMNVDTSKKVQSMDLRVDELHNEISDFLLHKIQLAPDKISEIRSHFLVVRNLERIGDHNVNICRYVAFIENNTVVHD